MTFFSQREKEQYIEGVEKSRRSKGKSDIEFLYDTAPQPTATLCSKLFERYNVFKLSETGQIYRFSYAIFYVYVLVEYFFT